VIGVFLERAEVVLGDSAATDDGQADFSIGDGGKHSAKPFSVQNK
jgi:hypothetical protein